MMASGVASFFGCRMQDARDKRQETRDKRATGVAMSDAALQALSDLRGLRGALSEW